MFDVARYIIAGLLISLGTFISPSQSLGPEPRNPNVTPTLVIATTSTPTGAPIQPTLTVIEPTAILQKESNKCAFDRERARAAGYSDEEIDLFLSTLDPDTCEIKNPDDPLGLFPSGSLEEEDNEEKINDTDNLPIETDIPLGNSNDYEFDRRIRQIQYEQQQIKWRQFQIQQEQNRVNMWNMVCGSRGTYMNGWGGCN